MLGDDGECEEGDHRRLAHSEDVRALLNRGARRLLRPAGLPVLPS